MVPFRRWAERPGVGGQRCRAELHRHCVGRRIGAYESLSETLRNFAEIGIAIAGFSAIAAALRSRVSDAWSEAERLALLSLLETSALVVFFALVPQVLGQILTSEHALWVSSNLMYAAVHSFHYFIQVRRVVPATATGGAPRPVGRATGWTLFLGGILLIGAQVALAAYGDLDQLRFIYLLVLTWHSCVAGVMFGTLILRFLRSDAA